LRLPGFIFWKSDFDNPPDGPPDALRYLSVLEQRYAGDEGKLELNRAAYNASKHALPPSVVGNLTDLDAAYAFCTVDADAPCSVLSIYTSGTRHRGVSQDYYQLPHAHCEDTTTLSATAQQKMKQPPVPLVENYLECRRTLSDTLLTSVGIAVGNVLSVKSALVLFFAFWLARYTEDGATGVKKGRKSRVPYTTYGTVERNKVLQYLAFNLLMARDGRHPPDSSPSEQQQQTRAAAAGGLVQELARELEARPSLHRFFAVVEQIGDSGDEQGSSCNPLQDEEGGVELGGAQTATQTGADSGLMRRRVKAFEDELLVNPMFLSDAEKKM
jgi:hypothetical protein